MKEKNLQIKGIGRSFSCYKTLLFFMLTVFLYLDAVAAKQPLMLTESEFQPPYLRIISLYSAHTENLLSLGAADQLAGISFSDSEVKDYGDKPRFSYRDDPERLLAINPDLVLIRPMIERAYPKFLSALRNAGIKIVSLQPRNVDEIFRYWRTLGFLCGKENEAREMISSFQKRTGVIAAKVATIDPRDRPYVYFQSIHSRSKTFAPESIGSYVLEQAGGKNIAADAKPIRQTNIAYFAKEQLLQRGDQVDVFIAQHGRMNPVTLEILYNEPGYGAIKAVREKRVYLIDEKIVSRPTVRLADGIAIFHQFLYPQSFNEEQ